MRNHKAFTNLLLSEASLPVQVAEFRQAEHGTLPRWDKRDDARVVHRVSQRVEHRDWKPFRDGIAGLRVSLKHGQCHYGRIELLLGG